MNVWVMLLRSGLLIRGLAAYAWWSLVQAGYVVRPYDMLADRRRWFWQEPTRCGWPA